MNNGLLFATDTFLWALQGMCELQRIPYAPELVLQQVPPPYNLTNLHSAAIALGLKAGVRQIAVADCAGLPRPFLAVMKPDIELNPASAVVVAANDESAGDQPKTAVLHRLALVLKIDSKETVLFDQSNERPFQKAIEDFEAQFAGQVVLFTADEKASTTTDQELKAKSEFGFKWFIPELLKHKPVWRDVLLASLVIQLMALGTPLFTQVVIDKVVVHHSMSTLVVIAVGMFVFLIFTSIMTWVRQYLVLHTGNRIDAVLGSQVFEHMFKLPPRYFDHRPTGVLTTRMQGVETIREFISGAAVTLCLDLPFLVIFLGIMFYYSWLLTLISLTILFTITVLSLLVRPLFIERLNQQFLVGARNQAFLTEYVSGMETVKSLQMEPQLGARYSGYLASYLKAGFSTRQLSNSFNVVANGLDQLQTLAILCVGAWLVMRDTGMTIGMLVAFQMFSSRLSAPVLRIVGLWQEFQQANIAVQRLGDVMNAPAEPYSVTPARQAGGEGKIEVRGIAFRYADNLPYLYQNLNLTIAPGQCIALMGPSGSGKSTLAKLMQGFYQPSDGSILIDDRDIRYFSANELRSHYGVVPQETILFSGSIYDNLVLANPHATFQEVIQACKLAEIHDTIEKLPEGYQTQIGEHGAGLSGGQKQRIAIARALLKKPKILIFDEATSSLDETTAEQFAKTVNQLKGKVSMLFIAHRLPEGLNIDELVKLSQIGGTPA